MPLVFDQVMCMHLSIDTYVCGHAYTVCTYELYVQDIILAFYPVNV